MKFSGNKLKEAAVFFEGARGGLRLVSGLGLFLWGLASSAACFEARGENHAGESVVVIYNSKMPESKRLAEYYAERRQVPGGQVFGFDLPTGEPISRTDFRELLQKPLFRKLEERELFVVQRESQAETSGGGGEARQRVVSSKIRYALLCYGVPVRILSDPRLREPEMDKLPLELRRNEAAVDSELALLPQIGSPLPLFGALANAHFGATNAAQLHPTNGILMVARLDGPTVEIARGLVDKAMQAETNGLWGRAFFDARGLTEGSYKAGDDWIKGAAEVARRVGFETILDDKPATFPAEYPLNQIALYAGWYDGQVSGPFTRDEVEFLPGAVAYHLHSFSGHLIRSADQYWVGPLLAKGATATMGCVDEPYLEGTPNIAVFFSRLVLLGFTFGEAAYASQNVLSWQTTVVGDPLYRPFGRDAGALHQELAERNSEWLEWSILRAINQNLLVGEEPRKYIELLEGTPPLRTSAVLQEKLGGLHVQELQFSKAVAAFQRALDNQPTRQQRIRIQLTMGTILENSNAEAEAISILEALLQENPDYPAPGQIYERLKRLAGNLGQIERVEEYQRRMEGL
jgi:uncharacterized protein (TIGR03790 family)